MDSMMDRQVGEIIGLLKETGIDDNTIIFFTSDNGAAKRFDNIHNSCGEMTGAKRSMNEGGIRVPMIVRWPGRIKAGSISSLPWYFPDVMPTLAELAGVMPEVPKDIDGISILPTLLGKGKQKKHEYLYWSMGKRKANAVRMGKWKGIRRANKMKLYDLSKDISEKNDLSAQYPDIAKKLISFMEKAWNKPRSQKDGGKYTGKKKKLKGSKR